jgi:hypothetical protein
MSLNVGIGLEGPPALAGGGGIECIAPALVEVRVVGVTRDDERYVVPIGVLRHDRTGREEGPSTAIGKDLVVHDGVKRDRWDAWHPVATHAVRLPESDRL